MLNKKKYKHMKSRPPLIKNKLKLSRKFLILILASSTTAIPLSAYASTVRQPLNHVGSNENSDPYIKMMEISKKLKAATTLLNKDTEKLIADTNSPGKLDYNQIPYGNKYTSTDWEIYKKNVSDDNITITKSLSNYNSVAKKYIDCLTAYNLFAEEKIDIHSFKQQFSSNNAAILKLKDDSITTAEDNYENGKDYSTINLDYIEVVESLNEYNKALANQNIDQETLQNIVENFPMQNSISGEPIANQKLSEWESQYCSAVIALQSDIIVTNTSQVKYNDSLEKYNKNNQNQFFSGNSSSITNNTAQDYLDNLQKDTNLQDLSKGTGLIPDSVNKYIKNQTIQDCFDSIIPSEQAFLDDAEQLSEMFIQLKNTIVDNYSSIANTTNSSIIAIQNGTFTSDDITNFVNFISQSNNILSQAEILRNQMSSLAIKTNTDYQKFIDSATAFNQLSEVTSGLLPSIPIGQGSNTYSLYQWINGSVLEQSSLNGLDGQAPSPSTQWTTDYEVISNAISNVSQAFSAAGYGVKYTGDGTDFSVYVQSIFDQYNWGDSTNLEDWTAGPVDEYALNASTPPTTWTTPQKPKVSPITPILLDTTYTPIIGTKMELSVPPIEPSTPKFYEISDVLICDIKSPVENTIPKKEKVKKSVLPPSIVPKSNAPQPQHLPETGENQQISYELTSIGIIFLAAVIVGYFKNHKHNSSF